MASDDDISDLWEDALDRYEKMAPDRSRRDQNLLMTIKTPEALEAHLDKHEKSFKLFRSKHAKLRGRLQACLQPFMALSDLVSGAVSASPFAPASTVLGAVCFLLKAADGVSEVYEWIEELFDKLRDFTVRLDIYVQRGLPKGFRDKIVDILGCLLEILACAEQAVKDGRWRKFAAVLFLGGDERVQAAFDKLAELFQSEQSLVLAISYATNQKMDQRIEEIGAISEALLKAATSANEENLRLSCLEWISPIDFSAQQSDNLLWREGNTGEWFLENSTFKNWMHGTDETWGLCCPGAPGAGKTTMAATVIHHLSKSGSSNKIGLAFLYCNYRSRTEQTLYNQLAALLRRLVQIRSTIPTFIRDAYQELKSNRKLTIQECIDHICSACKEFDKVYVVVDAVDECQVDVARALFKTIGTVRKHSDVRLMMTTRFITSIQEMIHEELGVIPQLEVRASDEDIRQYFLSRLPGCKSFLKKNDNLAVLAREKVVEAAGGMFLLARLHIDRLTAMVVPAQVKSALSKTFKTSSSDLYSMKAYSEQYDLAMERIQDQPFYQVELARATLLWLTFARRPLEPAELCSAVAMGLSDDKNNLDGDYIPEIGDLISLCAGLVTFDEEANVVRHVHYTTQEYFEQTHEKWFPDAEKRLALTCISYLSLDEFKKGGLSYTEWQEVEDTDYQKRLNDFPFVSYAATFWVQHARSVESDIVKEIQNLLFSYAILDSITSITSAEMRGPEFEAILRWEKLTPIIVIVREGLTRTLKESLSAGMMGTTPEDYVHEHAPLYMDPHIAALDERLGVSVIESNEEDIRRGLNTPYRPLHEAASHGQLEIVEILLNQRVNASLWDGDGHALAAAASRGYIDIVQTLLNFWRVTEQDLDGMIENMVIRDKNSHAGASGNQSMRSDRLKHPHELIRESIHSAVKSAIDAGHEQVARLLIQHGGYRNIHRVIADHTGPFTEEVVEKLLAMGFNVNSSDDRGSTGLHFAASRGDDNMVRLLLNHGADVSCESHELGTTLEAAAQAHHIEIVRIFLDHGIDINVETRHSTTMLTNIMWFGPDCIDIVRLLLDQGAQVDKHFGGRDGNALMAAASYGLQDICALLLDYGADVNLRSGIPLQSALEMACWSGSLKVLETLLEKGSDTPSEGMSLSRDFMSKWFRKEEEAVGVLQTLRKHNVRLELEGDEFHEPAIYQAVRYGAPWILEELLNAGADINAQFGKHGNILHQALAGYPDSDLKEDLIHKYDHRTCVEILLDRGFDINSTGKCYPTTLAAAIFGSTEVHSTGAKDTVTPLLDRKVRIPSDGPALLEQCAFLEMSHVVQYLVDGGVNLMASTSQPEILVKACSKDFHCEETLELLVVAGVDVALCGSQALHRAAYRKREDTVRWLLEHGVDANASGDRYPNALIAAIEGEIRMDLWPEPLMHVTEALVEHGFNMTLHGPGALKLASSAFGDEAPMCKLLRGMIKPEMVELSADG